MTLDVDALRPLGCAERTLAVLTACGVDPAKWEEAARVAPAQGETAVCRLGDGIWALELWHTKDMGLTPAARATADVYQAMTGDTVPDCWLYLADLLSAYCDLVEDGEWKEGATMNVVCSTRHPAFVGAAVAQLSGAPLYTVVGEDDGALENAIEGGTLPPYLDRLGEYVQKNGRKKVFRDILAARADEGEATDAMLELLDETGYLTHPVTAKAYRIAQIYREEAESRNPVLVIAPFHPYAADKTLVSVVCERTAKDAETNMRLLEEETGWEIPEELKNEDFAETIREQIKTLYGE